MYEQIAANKRRTVVLVAVFVLVLATAGAAAGYLVGFGWYGVIIAFVVSGALAFASYWKSDAVARAVSRARPADPSQYKRLYNLVKGCASPAACRNHASTSSTTRPRTPSPPAATP